MVAENTTGNLFPQERYLLPHMPEDIRVEVISSMQSSVPTKESNLEVFLPNLTTIPNHMALALSQPSFHCLQVAGPFLIIANQNQALLIKEELYPDILPGPLVLPQLCTVEDLNTIVNIYHTQHGHKHFTLIVMKLDHI